MIDDERKEEPYEEELKNSGHLLLTALPRVLIFAGLSQSSYLHLA